MSIHIRKAEESDMERIMHVERNSYPSQLWAPEEVLVQRMKDFGIWVAEYEGVVRGFFTCVPAKLGLSFDLERIKKNRNPHYLPWFKYFKKGGKFDTLWVTSTAVESDFQKLGIGRALVEKSLDLAKEQGLRCRASALRCEYAQFFVRTRRPIEEYIAEVKQGTEKDAFLSLYHKMDFILSYPLRNYETNPGSLNWNVLAFKNVIKLPWPEFYQNNIAKRY